MDNPSGPIILYDGVCGLCNRLNQFVLQRDRAGVFRFSPLQSDYARRMLPPHGVDPSDLDTLYVLVDAGLPTQRLVSRSRAVLHVLDRLGGVWKALSLMRLLPGPFLDLGYNLVARTRYRLFGHHDECLLPRRERRDRFIVVRSDAHS